MFNGNLIGSFNKLSKEMFEHSYGEYRSSGLNHREALGKAVEAMGMNTQMVVFFGFTGRLANHIAIINKDTIEDVRNKCLILDDTIPTTFFSITDFACDLYKKEMIMVDIEDIYINLRINSKIKKDEVFEDVEVDEFDDNCNEDCIPGKHSCGK